MATPAVVYPDPNGGMPQPANVDATGAPVNDQPPVSQMAPPTPPPQAYQKGLAPGASVDAPVTAPIDKAVVQLSDGRKVIGPRNNLPGLLADDHGAKEVPVQQGQVAVRLSDGRVVVGPMANLGALQQDDPGAKVEFSGSGDVNMQENATAKYLMPAIKHGAGPTGAIAGAEGGALGGAAIGTAVAPGPGTVVGGVIGAGVGAFTGREAGEHIANTVRDDEQKKGEGEIAGEGGIDALFAGAGGLLKEGLELAGQARKLPIQETLTGMASNPELRNLALRVGGKTVVGAILYSLPKIPELVKGVVLAKMGIEGPIWHDVVMLAQHPAIRNAAIDATQVMAKGAKVAPAAGAAVSAATQSQIRVFDPVKGLQPVQ